MSNPVRQIVANGVAGNVQHLVLPKDALQPTYELVCAVQHYPVRMHGQHVFTTLNLHIGENMATFTVFSADAADAVQLAAGHLYQVPQHGVTVALAMFEPGSIEMWRLFREGFFTSTIEQQPLPAL